MCGILGFTHRSQSVPLSVLSTALCTLRHRGPDHDGIFQCPEISLGAVRLRILDLEGGDQPMHSPDGNVVLVFNGEVFNYPELRDQLETHGHSFTTRCDTEVVLKAFLQWGTDAFRRMRGMFALALWVRSERRLVLARDPAGIKPLYYCEVDGELYFASEVKALFVHPAVSRRLCLAALNCYLSLDYVPGPYTLVEGIRKLMPGEMLVWKAGACRVEPYLPEPAPQPPPSSVEAACEELHQLLTLAVQEQLVSDVPLGIWLSGGLDSSTILHYAAEAHSAPLRTFSITFRGRSFDESNYMELVSRRYGTQHSEFDLTEEAPLVDAIENIAYYSDDPSGDAGALPVWFLAQMTRKEVTVVLTGEGSDELFAGYLTYRADCYAGLARLIPAPLRRAALYFAAAVPVSDEKIGFEYKLKRFLAGALMPPALAHVYWNGTFTESEKASFFRFADPAPLASILAGISTSNLSSFLRFDQRYYLPDDILYKVDRMSMAHSLEARPPFLDPRVVGFANRLPDHFKLRGLTSKFILRRLMRGKLPPQVLKRSKIGFDVPIHQWFRSTLRHFLLDTLSPEAVAATGLFNPAAVQTLIRSHLEKKSNLGYHLWGLLVLFLWMRRWGIALPRLDSGTLRQESSEPVALSLLPQSSSISQISSARLT